ncbi:PhzF family phenazine biosynthesis protein [Spartinivicinus poritis]|uniref:PhzF family phenazine biosynthesis protein n=1 Tax=Spartinivicinus poritis TaxID=2994640 RepID=A0ABT5UJS2_9GAMM|nr:PhzF family phenazine biosynthesis protein [Spartinivicinus sp. A2-2]MDE1465284.1 PhzF family phenazine biosynthesis protein [Spartinivicinus sp. A2-2]
MLIDVAVLNAFTYQKTGGNPAGVVLDAHQLSAPQMQQIATQVGLSETVFILPSTQGDFTTRFFTPTDEVNYCGHATLAAFSLIYQQKIIQPGRFLQEINNQQLLAITVEDDGQIIMTQQRPQFLTQFQASEVAPLLNLPVELLSETNLPIQAISTGLVDVFVPIPEGFLDHITQNEAAVTEFSTKHDFVGLHLFELPTKLTSFSARCRNFAPRFGIPEESATGSSSGALACYLSTYVDQAKTDFLFEQGKAMQCCSSLSATLRKSGTEIVEVQVGGYGSQPKRVQVNI